MAVRDRCARRCLIYYLPMPPPCRALDRSWAILGEFTGDKIIDLLFHLPSNLIDRQYRPSLAKVEDSRIATLKSR